MSEDVFQMIKNTNIHELKMQLALQCAPLLAGLKLSNLLIISSDDEAQVRHLFRNSGIAARVIYQEAPRTTFYLYRPKELEAYLKKPRVLALLRWLGYEQTQPREVLSRFCDRYQSYRRGKNDFPHEMGLLLGYPPEDVYSFIINKGKNDLYSGYWKIYDNLSDTLKLFEQFNQAKEFMIRQVFAGVSISEILRQRFGYAADG